MINFTEEKFKEIEASVREHVNKRVDKYMETVRSCVEEGFYASMEDDFDFVAEYNEWAQY